MFGDLTKIMSIVGELKTKLPEMKAKLAESRYAADAGGGFVEAVVNGKLAIVDLKIDPEVLGKGDAIELADLIRAAVAAAQEKANIAAAEAMKELTGGMDLPGLEALLS